MKNTSMILFTILAIAIGGTAVYVVMNQNGSIKNSDSMNTDELVMEDSSNSLANTSQNSETENSEEIMMDKRGRYVPFSPEILADSANSRRVIFFYANWCPTCKPADTSFTENQSQLPADVTVIRVNYNDTQTDQAEKDLAKKYGVTYQHTFVQIDAAGDEVTKWNGGKIEELLANLK